MSGALTDPGVIKKNLKAYVLLTFTTGCWGANVILGKLAVGEISPMLLVSLRWLSVLILLVLFARKHLVRDWPVLRNHLVFVGLMGTVGFTSFNALFYMAAHSTSAINIGILQGSIPVFVLLGTFLLYRSRITRLQACGVAVTLIGVIIVASGGDLAQLQSLSINRGDFFILLACFFYAAYSIGLSRRPAVSALGLFTALAFVAFIVSLPLLAIEVNATGFRLPSLTGWVVVALVALLPSLVAQISFIHSVSLIGPARAGVFINLVPVFASIMAVVFLRESFEYFQALALGLVLGGIWLSEIGKVK
ncbi:MAG: DMT family transporter [Gammaproteobacteria bacterium]|nr:DMT family transporter [Gammaproteobacteria bacterium]